MRAVGSAAIVQVPNLFFGKIRNTLASARLLFFLLEVDTSSCASGAVWRRFYG